LSGHVQADAIGVGPRAMNNATAIPGTMRHAARGTKRHTIHLLFSFLTTMRRTIPTPPDVVKSAYRERR
jgi:hypothetical protein